MVKLCRVCRANSAATWVYLKDFPAGQSATKVQCGILTSQSCLVTLSNPQGIFIGQYLFLIINVRKP